MTTAGGRPGQSRAVLAGGLLLLAVVGAILATLPHAIARIRTGDPTYLPDGDGLLYLAWSRDAVWHGEAHLSDAIHRPSGPMMHPWPLFVPLAGLAHSLGLGMAGLGILWRVAAGSLLALSLYAAIRPTTRGAGVAIGLAGCLICDPGMMFGQLIRREGEIFLSLARGSHSFLTGVPRLLPHLRVVTPGLALPALLLHFAAMSRARLGGGTARRGLAVATFGLLFYVYFYYWTMVLLGLGLAIALDREGRKLASTVLAGGLILGIPALWIGAEIKRSTPGDWLWRTDKFVAIGHFEHLLWPRGVIVLWLATTVWVFRKRPELIYAWCCTGAGLVCLNHQVFTGLQIENDHWSSAYGTSFSLLLASLVAPAIDRAVGSGRVGRWGLGAILTVQVAIGFGLRGVEATRSDETALIHDLYDRWRGDPSLRDLPAGSVVAGDPDLLFLAAALSEVDPLSCRLVEFSARADDAELDERLILNDFLRGIGKDEARRSIELPARGEARRLRRRALIESIWDDPTPSIDKFGVSWVVLPAGHPGDHLAGFAQPTRSGPADRAWKIHRFAK